MTKVVVVYHSGYGHTKKQAESVLAGAAGVSDVITQLVSVADIDAHWQDLEAADAIIFGAPTYMGSVSGDFKKFMDASSKPWFSQAWKDKVAGGFTNSGSLSGDKLNSLIQLSVFAAQHGMIWVGTGLMPAGYAQNPGGDVNRTGSSLGAVAQSTNASAEETPSGGDLETARLYGERVATVTKKLRA
jgi:NAD(P)H dehydrogenase (quinone)